MQRVGFLYGICLLALLAGCGGSSPKAKNAETEPDTEERQRVGRVPETSAEIGALDEGKVENAFSGSIKALQACLNSGAKRVEFIGGSVGFFVKVDASGHLSHAHVEQSSIGDRETEKCMLDALKSRSWPAPVGGEVGLARKSFDFDPPNDVREPVEWSADRVSDGLSDKSSEIQKCKKDAPGTYAATMYVNTNGTVLSAGIAPPDERGEDAVDCLVSVLTHTKFPSPGSWPAKVSFSL